MDYGSLIASALFGALGGGLGALVSILIKGKDKEDSKWSVLLVPLGVMAGFAVENVVPLAEKPVLSYAVTEPKKADLDEVLADLARRTNETLPQTIDAGTRLDNVSAGKHRYRYNYTLTQATVWTIDRDEFRNDGYFKIRDRVCSSEEMKPFVDNSVIVEYAYRDRNGVDVATITLDTSECKKPAARSPFSQAARVKPSIPVVPNAGGQTTAAPAPPGREAAASPKPAPGTIPLSFGRKTRRGLPIWNGTATARQLLPTWTILDRDSVLRLLEEAETPEERCDALNKSSARILEAVEKHESSCVGTNPQPISISDSWKYDCVRIGGPLDQAKSYCKKVAFGLGTKWVPKTAFERSGDIGDAIDGEIIKAGEELVVGTDSEALLRLGSGDTFRGKHQVVSGSGKFSFSSKPVSVEGRVLSPYFSWWPGERLVELTMIELQGEMHPITTSKVSVGDDEWPLPPLELLEDVEVRAEEIRIFD